MIFRSGYTSQSISPKDKHFITILPIWIQENLFRFCQELYLCRHLFLYAEDFCP